jgi:hypothetical protein
MSAALSASAANEARDFALSSARNPSCGGMARRSHVKQLA